MGSDSRNHKKKSSSKSKKNKPMSSGIPGEEDNSKQEESSKKKLSKEALLKCMEPSKEELAYREGKLENINVKEYSTSFKCTKCQLDFKPIIESHGKVGVHPFLGVLLCADCCDYYEDGEFSLDSDGEDKYCRWCGEGGLLFACSRCICGFCRTCLKKHFGPEFLKQVQNDDDWQCFFCNPEPLWHKRFICSFAIQMSEKRNEQKTLESLNKNVANSNNSNSTKAEDILSTLELCRTENKNVKQDLMKETSLNESDNSGRERRSLSKKRTTINKRKRIYSSSSDESDNDKKEFKYLKTNAGVSPVSNKKSEAVERLEKVLKLVEYQLGFGVNWTSKELKKMASSSHQTIEAVKKESQKIKWFLSVLTTHLLDLCNSVDMVEKSLVKEEGTNNSAVVSKNASVQQSSLDSVLQFLGFMSNQVKAFIEKGVSLKDVLESEIYEDSQVIGIIKSTSRSSPQKNEAISPKRNGGKAKNWENMSSQSSKDPLTNKTEGENQLFEEDDKSSNDEDNMDLVMDVDSETDCSEEESGKGNNIHHPGERSGTFELRNQGEDMKKILAILEHA